MKTTFLAMWPVLFVLMTSSALMAQPASQQPESAPGQSRPDPAQITDERTLVEMAGRHETAGDWSAAAAALGRLVQLRPHNPHYLYRLATVHARADNKSGGYDALLKLQGSGMGFDLAADPRLANLHGTQVWDHLVNLNQSALEPFGDGDVAFELPAADLLLESLAYDAQREAFLFGSARDGVIYRRGADGGLTPWASPQGEQWWSIMQMAIDPDGRHLWATTAAVPHFKEFKTDQGGRSALLKIDLADGKLVQAYPAPNDGQPHLFNTIAVSPRGLVVVADGLRGQIFKLEDGALTSLIAERQLNSLRGMAFSSDSATLYFADYEYGLFGLHLASRTAFAVAAPGNIILYGIEGLFRYEDQLIAIQNGVQPQRVVRFKLDDSGRRIELVVPLESAQPAFATPTVGALRDADLFYIANSQRGYYDGYGLLRGGRELPPVKVFRTNARFNWDYELPRMPTGRGG